MPSWKTELQPVTVYIIRVNKSRNRDCAWSLIEEMKNAYKTLNGELEVCRQLATPRNKWENNINMSEKLISFKQQVHIT